MKTDTGRALAALVGLAALLLGVLWLVHTLAAIDAKRVQAEQRADLAEAALDSQVEAQARADVLSTRLAAAEAGITHLTRERDDAIQLATSGRACLRGAAVRVLNGAPGLRVAVDPAAAGVAAAASAAAAADPGARGIEPGASGLGADAAELGAAHLVEAAADDADGLIVTDTAVGRWMLAAGAAHETCRLRLDALIDYLTAEDERP